MERNARLAPKETNAAYRIRDLWNGLPVEFRNTVRAGVLPKEFRALDRTDPHRPWPGPAVEAVRATLRPRDGDVATLRSLAAETTGSGFPTDRALGLAASRDDFEILSFLALGRWLQADVRVCLADGRAEDAVADVRAMLGLCRVVGDQPSAVAQLLRMAMARLAVRTSETCLGQAEPRSLEAVQNDFWGESRVPLVEPMALGDRLWVNEMLAELDAAVTPEYYRRLDATGAPREYPTAWQVARWKWGRKDLPDQRASALERATEVIRMSRSPYRGVAGRLSDFDGTPGLNIQGLSLAGCGPYVKSQFEARAELRCAAAALACERYRRQFGHWPVRLTDIPPSILGERPGDPYDGEPVRLAATADGLVVYCVGSDLTDDGGSLTKNATGKVDVGFRLYDVAHRRVPGP